MWRTIMADARLTSNRRSFLASVPAAAAAATIPASAVAFTVTSRGAWDLAWQRYREAEAEMNAYSAQVFDPAYAREVAFERAHGAIIRQPGYWEKRAAITAKHGTGYRVPDALGQ